MARNLKQTNEILQTIKRTKKRDMSRTVSYGSLSENRTSTVTSLRSEVINRDKNQRPGGSVVAMGDKLVINEASVVKTVALVDRLLENEYMSPVHKSGVNDIAIAGLAGLNVTIRNDINRGYSLLTETCQERELLENPNIIDPSIRNLENQLQDPQLDKFPNKEDPFYELDDDFPIYIKEQKKELKQFDQKNVVKIAGDLFQQNTRETPGTLKLKQLTKYSQGYK